jgi:ubiquinone/menaquinone biosynthesis C-methylase UbiE
MSEWFESWFGEDYVALYPHRDAAEAGRAVALIESVASIAPGSRALDLACGAGRHSKVLAERWWTAGLDLSEVLLRLAHRDRVDAAFVRGDMRVLPFRDASFRLVVNLFTSFGYFADDESHLHVVKEVARVTSAGGTFVLDFLNTAHLRDTLVPYDERTIGDKVVEQRRTISHDGRYVVKRICIRGIPDKEYVERVRLFEAGDLTYMLRAAGFRVSSSFGNYDATPLSDESPRAILFGTRN